MKVKIARLVHLTCHDGNRTNAPRQKAPNNEIIIQSYYNFYIDGDIKYILKIKTNTYWKRRGGEFNTKYKILKKKKNPHFVFYELEKKMLDVLNWN